MTAWGQRGENGKETRAGLLQQRARHRGRSEDAAASSSTTAATTACRCSTRTASSSISGASARIPSDVHLFHIFSDGYLWAFDRGTSKMLKYDLNGNFLYSWGTWGDFPGAFWGVHGFSVDQDGNFYTAAVDTGGAQKLVPRKGANPAMHDRQADARRVAELTGSEA